MFAEPYLTWQGSCQNCSISKAKQQIEGRVKVFPGFNWHFMVVFYEFMVSNKELWNVLDCVSYSQTLEFESVCLWWRRDRLLARSVILGLNPLLNHHLLLRCLKSWGHWRHNSECVLLGLGLGWGWGGVLGVWRGILWLFALRWKWPETTFRE